MGDRLASLPVPKLFSFAREKDWQDNPRQTALAAIIELYPDRPQSLELVRDRALNDRDQKLREFAQEKLTQLEGQ